MKLYIQHFGLWLSEQPTLGLFAVSVVGGFLFLLLAYLFFANIRLHIHIRRLNRDKMRLMEEKDLIRKGMSMQEQPLVAALKES